MATITKVFNYVRNKLNLAINSQPVVTPSDIIFWDRKSLTVDSNGLLKTVIYYKQTGTEAEPTYTEIGRETITVDGLVTTVTRTIIQ